MADESDSVIEDLRIVQATEALNASFAARAEQLPPERRPVLPTSDPSELFQFYGAGERYDEELSDLELERVRSHAMAASIVLTFVGEDRQVWLDWAALVWDIFYSSGQILRDADVSVPSAPTTN